MAKVKYDTIVSYQEGWQNTNMPEEKIKGLIALSNKLMHKLIDNNHDLDGITLSYPKDCKDYATFTSLAYAFGAYLKVKEDGSGIITMYDFGHNKDDIEVE